MEIIDLTEPEEEDKPLEKIKLISCLQSETNDLGQAYFYESNYLGILGQFTKTTRVLRKAFGDMDLIILERDSYSVVFLGYWNDGVI